MSAAPVDALVLDPADDVAVLIRAGAPGETLVLGGAVVEGRVALVEAIAKGHKVALRDLPAGATVNKHGAVIGRLVAPVGRGAHVHVHNLVSLRG
jgi:hypothetical protein